jgi:phage-related protein
MAFYASSFQFDGIASETHDLLISEIEGSAVDSTMGSSNMDILSQKIYRRSTPYFYGATPSENLSFEISANTLSGDEIDAEDFQIIQAWLFSPRTYRKLLIMQPDMESVYFNSIFNSPKILRVGNKIVGFTATVQCDSPFAWKYPKTTTYTYTVPTVDSSVVFNNTSDDRGAYLYPTNVITMNTFGGSVTITNSSDASRVMTITGLSGGEVITMNSSIQTLSSSLGFKRMSNFNKHFLRLVPGVNNLRLQGNFSSMSVTVQTVAKKIGG